MALGGLLGFVFEAAGDLVPGDLFCRRRRVTSGLRLVDGMTPGLVRGQWRAGSVDVRPGAMVAGEAIVVLPELPAEPHRATDMHDREGSGVDGDVYRFDIEGGTLEWAIPRGSVQCVREWLEPHT